MSGFKKKLLRIILSSLLLCALSSGLVLAAPSAAEPVNWPASATQPGNRIVKPLQLAQADTAAAPAVAKAGPQAATYVGEARCVNCHALEKEHFAHTVHNKAFRLNPKNDLEKKTCEACHGPGSKHLENASDKTALINFTRKGDTPVDKQNGQCLQCHKGGQRIAWSGSMHQTSQLGCADCHNPMAKGSPTGLLVKKSITETCFTCHQQQRAEFNKRSHMPVTEGKMSCEDCHNPHGTNTRPMLKADNLNQLCYTCHAEKRGPFTWEHAPVRENCMNCHSPHGSNNEKLLTVSRPFLCQQCHTHVQHPNDLVTKGNTPAGTATDARGSNRNCQNCHTQIHGSNSPSGVRMHR